MTNGRQKNGSGRAYSCHSLVDATTVRMLALFLMFWQAHAITEISLSWLYERITTTHETMELCKNQLDQAFTDAKVSIRGDLRRFINANSVVEKHRIDAEYDTRIRQRLRLSNTTELCAHKDYANFKSLFRQSMTQASIASLRERLEKPADPSEGDCF